MGIFPAVGEKTPHCSIPLKGACQHADLLTSLANRDHELSPWRQELRADIKDIKLAVQGIETLKVEHGHHKEALNRAFTRIEGLETYRIEVQQFIARVDGMRAMAWALWTLLASGVGVALVKLFSLS